MKIGINVLYLRPGKVGGTQTYADGLLAEISSRKSKHTYYVFCGKDYARLLRNHSKLKIVILPFVTKNRVARIFIEQVLLPYYVIKLKIQTLHSLGYTCPAYLPVKNIVTIHDLNWYYHPEDFTMLNRWAWKTLITLSSKSSSHIMTDSFSSQKSLIEMLKISKKKISVVYPGLPHTTNPHKDSLLDKKISNKYLLTVTSLVPHKNVYVLLRAFKQVLRTFPDRQLVIVGLGGVSQHKVLSYIEKNFQDNQVLILGWVNESTLSLLYQRCEVFVFTSLYEGFGFPILEAFSYKAPVVTSKAYSLAEVVGGAAETINPRSVSDITRGISKVLNDSIYKKSLIRAGTQQINKFSWPKFLKKVEYIYTK